MYWEIHTLNYNTTKQKSIYFLHEPLLVLCLYFSFFFAILSTPPRDDGSRYTYHSDNQRHKHVKYPVIRRQTILNTSILTLIYSFYRMSIENRLYFKISAIRAQECDKKAFITGLMTRDVIRSSALYSFILWVMTIIGNRSSLLERDACIRRIDLRISTVNP